LTFSMDATNETVTFTVVAVSASGQKAPTTDAPMAVAVLSPTSGTLTVILGHTNPKMTLDRYAHLSPEYVQRQSVLMDRMYGSNTFSTVPGATPVERRLV